MRGKAIYMAVSLPITILIVQTFQVIVVLLFARLMGLRLRKVGHHAQDQEGQLQFSVGQALSWMTALTVFMAATRYLMDYLAVYSDARANLLSASYLAVALATMWLMLGNGRIGLRCFTLVVIIGLGTAWIAWLGELPWWDCAYLLALQAAVTAVSLAVVRLAGYRLVWHWPFRRPKP